MTSIDTGEFRELLVADRHRTQARMLALGRDFTSIVDATRGANTDDEHDPEGSTIAFERSQTSALLVAARTHLDEVDQALQRLEAATYGICRVCGNPIPVERLRARPVATTCITHAARR